MDCRLVRVQTLATRLSSAGLDPQKVHVLASPTVGAYSWASGDVYVAAGLVDGASDDEITAALAHELGHLVHEYGLFSPAGLDGRTLPPSADIESRADMVAVALMDRQKLPREALVSVLQRIAIQDASLEKPIAARIALIRGVAGPKPIALLRK